MHDDTNEYDDQAPVKPGRLRALAKEHRLNPGDFVIELTVSREDGTFTRSLYRYDTGAGVYRDELESRGLLVTRALVRWDGVTDVDFCNGD